MAGPLGEGRSPRVASIQLLAILVFVIPAHATVWDVPAQCPTIQAGIDSAGAGDTVLVACGTYFEHQISMGDGVVLRSETGEPDCVTIDADSLGGVISCFELSDAATTIEGFTITGGYGFNGGGVASSASQIRVVNCDFIANYAANRGGGLYRIGGRTEVVDCTFQLNVAGDGGGGAQCRGSDLGTSFTNCTFLENTTARRGGGLEYVVPAPGSNRVTVTGCTFDGNFAEMGGGGLSCGGSGVNILLDDCLFVGNTADSTDGVGGGFRVFSVAESVTVTSCTFEHNYAHDGGGMYSELGDPVLTDVTFRGNGAFVGGGLCTVDGAPELIGGLFVQNSATLSIGGGLHADRSDVVLTGVTFDDNAGSGGGALSCLASAPQVTGCSFLGNHVGSTGGGVYAAEGSAPVFSDCLFSGNWSSFYSGALAFYGASTGSVANCTLYGNDAPSGGAFVARGGSQVSVENTIVAFQTGGTVAYCTDSSAVALSCCDVYGNDGGDWTGCFAGQSASNGNLSSDPLFCDAPGRDFRLDATSPCLDAPGCERVGAFDAGCGAVSGVGEETGYGPAFFGFVRSGPNPVHGEARLAFSLPEPGRASLTVHDAAGRRVATLADRWFEAGASEATWNGRDGAGRRVSSGVYFCFLRLGDREANKKIVLVVK